MAYLDKEMFLSDLFLTHENLTEAEVKIKFQNRFHVDVDKNTIAKIQYEVRSRPGFVRERLTNYQKERAKHPFAGYPHF
jgi:hypothetical protein